MKHITLPRSSANAGDVIRERGRQKYSDTHISHVINMAEGQQDCVTGPFDVMFIWGGFRE